MMETFNVCRSIQTLFNFDPPATDVEIRAAARQFVRKLSGTTRPSKANEAAFETAVDQVMIAAHALLASLTTFAPPRNRDAQRARAIAARARSYPAVAR